MFNKQKLGLMWIGKYDVGAGSKPALDLEPLFQNEMGFDAGEVHREVKIF